MKLANKSFLMIKESTLKIIDSIFIVSLFTFLILLIVNILTNDFIENFINPAIFLWPLSISLFILLFNNYNIKDNNKNTSALLRFGLSIIGFFIFYFIGKELGSWRWIISLSIFIIIFSSTKNISE